MRQAEWRPERSEQAVRLRPLRFLALPWRDRAFLHARYERLLQDLADESRFHVVPLRELREAPADRVVVGLRHDVDDRLPSALAMARIEHEYGLRATYYILHTAPYYGDLRRGHAARDEGIAPRLRELQDLGHEVGWHNDLVTLECVYDIDPRDYLARELRWLRSEGVDVVGCASHGSYWCHRLGFTNAYFFSELDDPTPRFPNNEVVRVDDREVRLSKGSLAEFGLEYDTSRLDESHYFSDGLYDADGRRWHPDTLDLARFEPGDRVILSTHPNHWDGSLGAKVAHNVARGANRLVTGRRA